MTPVQILFKSELVRDFFCHKGPLFFNLNWCETSFATKVLCHKSALLFVKGKPYICQNQCAFQKTNIEFFAGIILHLSEKDFAPCKRTHYWLLLTRLRFRKVKGKRHCVKGAYLWLQVLCTSILNLRNLILLYLMKKDIRYSTYCQCHDW